MAWLVPGSLAALPCRAACPGALTLPLTVRQILPGVWSPATNRGTADDVTNALQMLEDSNNALLRGYRSTLEFTPQRSSPPHCARFLHFVRIHPFIDGNMAAEDLADGEFTAWVRNKTHQAGA